MEKEYEIWMGTFMIQGMSSPAEPTFQGKAKGKDFKEACKRFFKNDKLYDEKRNTLWGCTLFSDKTEAYKQYLK